LIALKPGWIMQENLLKSGIRAKKGILFIKNLGRFLGRRRNIAKRNARRAAILLLRQKTLNQNSVQVNVSQHGEDGQVLIMSVKNARSAVVSFTPIKTKKSDVAAGSAQAVYALSTTHGMYYANNVLVSNCDAVRYALSSAVRAKMHVGFQAGWAVNPTRLAGGVAQW
jgi:hypothetical protein